MQQIVEQVIELSIDALKIHPRNQEFFDDIEGEMYEQFKQSIKEDGVLTPIVVAPDMTIISGHQRYQACKDLHIKLIPAIIRRELIDEDLKLRQLIASNFGRLSNNPSKFRKAVAMYVELNGSIGKGTYKQNRQHGTLNLTQTEIAEQLGISERELQKLLQIERNLIPELKQTLDQGFISKTAALTICSKLDKSEQQELLEEIVELIGVKTEENPEKEKVSVSNKEVETLTAKVQELQNINKDLVEKNTELLNLQSEKKQLEEKIQKMRKELIERPSIEVKVEVEKEENLLLLKKLQEKENQLKKERDDYQEKYSNALKRLNSETEKVSYFMSSNQNFQLTKRASELINSMKIFIKDMTDLGFFADIDKLPDGTREEYIRAIYGVYKWSRNTLNEVDCTNVIGVDKNVIEIINQEDLKYE